jgi:hypothetical protein
MVITLKKLWGIVVGNSASLDADMSPSDQYSEAVY